MDLLSMINFELLSNKHFTFSFYESKADAPQETTNHTYIVEEFDPPKLHNFIKENFLVL